MSQLDQLAYTVRQVAHLLSVTPPTVYRMVREGDLPSVRIGSSIRVPADALTEYLARHAAHDVPPSAA
ncbi:MAG: helix-turn-helix domain-containing protein [Acidimicrobiales bacterium]|jgi:excisionase family DNA binding protein